MKKLLALLFLIPWLSFGAQPNPQAIATGTIGATGVVCSMNNPYATSYTIILDCITGAGVGTVAIQTQSVTGGAFQTVATGLGTNPITATATTYQLTTIAGPLIGIQFNVTAFTSGTIRATIIAN